MPAVRSELVWNKCRGNAWGELYAVDLAHRHFDGLEGVFVLWHGGAQPEAVFVGFGLVRDCLAACRREPQVAAFKPLTLYVTWARIDRIQAPGVLHYLALALQPRVATRLPDAKPIEVNLPGQEEAAPTGPPGAARPSASPGDLPGQHWEDLLVHGGPPEGQRVEQPPPPPPPAPKPPPPPPPQSAPKPAPLTPIRRRFAELLKTKPPPKKGLFGGQEPPPEQEATVVSATQILLEEAVRAEASDIHLEPLDDALRVRFRVDGMLEEVLSLPRALDLRIISRIRVLCGLDPEQGGATAKPQDGRMMVALDGKEVDLRLSTFPTVHGDKAVLRLIRRDTRIPKLSELGFQAAAAEALAALSARSQGMIVVTGPAGNGKSTTLYTILQTLNTLARNIVTLEDPVEMKIRGVNQSAVQPKAGFTFASGLRAILRQDPNVVMVGEIRDLETAEIAMSASLTGHLLFTTLHTNNAVGAITRLLDMGLEPYLIASALTAVCAQRLARRICADCREPSAPPPQTLDQLEETLGRAGVGFPVSELQNACRGKGCEACRGTGYRGRLLLFELVRMGAGLRALVLQKASVSELQTTAVREGMEPLLVDGLRRVASGECTLEEVLRVAGAAD